MHDLTANNRFPRFVVQYEMSEELARQAGADLWDSRVMRLKSKYPEWGNTRPLLILGLAGLQIVVAMVALFWVSDGIDTIGMVLLVACGFVLLVLLYKAIFYAMPFLGRWVAGRQVVRLARGMEHAKIRWRLYDDRVETESAVIQRSVPWSEVENVQESGKSMVVRLRNGTELMVPVAVLGEEACGFIKSRMTNQA